MAPGLGVQGRGFGTALALAAAVCFAFANTIVRAVYDGGSDPISVSGTRFILPFLILVGYALWCGSPIILPRRDGIWALLLGVVTALYTVSLLTALGLLPVGIAILVFYLFPILTVAISAAMGWTRLSVRAVGAALVALAGLAFALGVGINDYNLSGIGLAALAALGLAVVSAVSGRVIGNSDPVRATIYMAVGAVLPLLGWVVLTGGFNWPETGAGWVGLIVSNTFYAAAMISYFVAIGLAGPPTVATMANLEPLVAITAAFLLFGQSLAPLQIAGATLVVGALIFAAQPDPSKAN